MIDQISVVIVTKNEAKTIAACLKALKRFDDVTVVDSNSDDNTAKIAETYGVRVSNFQWNGVYPKKRQWCLDHLNLRDWVLFIDADEHMTYALFDEIQALNGDAAGYFIKGRYVYDGKALNHGLKNNKLCLFNRHKMHFPVVDDLDILDMGEIEGHYQPVLNNSYKGENIGQLKHALMHVESGNWAGRHKQYAIWQAAMNARQENPEPVRRLKKLWHVMPLKPIMAFMHSYLLKCGILDGRAGALHAYQRGAYYAMIARASKNLAR